MESMIEIKNLKKFYGTKQILRGVNMSVGKGELIGYIGKNGAGKTTTVKLMMGIIGDYSGSIRIFGQNINEVSQDYKKRIGYVPEAGGVYEVLTGMEYLQFLNGIYGLPEKGFKNRMQELMSLFQLNVSEQLPISEYSKGMRQKLMILAGIFHNPEIIFLDEPMSGLDANMVSIFKELLNQWVNEGKTIFYSSHIMDVVEKISHRILLLNDGEIVADGPFEEIKKQFNYGSLEEMFSKVTGFDGQKETAHRIIEVVGGLG